MDKAISIGDINTATLQRLLGFRCLRAAGVTIFDSVAQTATVTLGGTKETGDKFKITINGIDYEYTVLVGDADMAAVATALAALVDANADVAAAAVGSVITVTASVASVAFTISVLATNVGAGNNDQTITLAHTVNSVKEIETDNAVEYFIDGKLYTKAATTAIVVGGSTLPVSSFRWYSVLVDASGNMTTAAADDNVAWLPAPPDTKTIIGAIKIVTDATHTFVPGTTALNATGITTTYYDLSTVPTAGVPA